MKRKRLYIIDGAGFYYRAYYGIRQNLTARDGTPTNAVYGFARMFVKIINEEKPDGLVIALDSREKTFRHEMYEDYKANRQAMPENLAVQLPLIERLIAAYNIAVLKKPGLEADDLIGAAALQAAGKGYDVTIVTGDKDLMQLVNDRITLYDSLKDKRIGIEQVKEKFGVEPGRVVEIMGLMGDSSDNIPGVPGVGEKTARKLIEKYGNIENLLERAEEIERPKLRQALVDNKDKARLSRELARIKTGISLDVDPDSWGLSEPEEKKLTELFAELDFKSFTGITIKRPEIRASYKTVMTEKELDGLVSILKNSSGFAVDTETTSKEPMRAELVGLSFSTKDGEGFYIPVAHDYSGKPKQLNKRKALEKLKPVLENVKIEKYGQNIKYDYIVLKKEGVDMQPLSFDTMLASYLLAPEERRHNLGHLSEKYIGHGMIEYADVAGKGAKQLTFNLVEISKAAEYSAEDADMTMRLTQILRKEIKEKGLENLYYSIELPLVKVLASMEQNGVAVNPEFLKKYSRRLDEELKKIEAQIYDTAGEEFNIASPKQLGRILFDVIKLKPVRKTKTGPSTDQKVLEKLSYSHPLPKLILRSRSLAKLKSTYVDPIPQLILPETGRVHTSFNQAAAATGRLSSSAPNLQNIPVRTEEGRKIREAFYAANECLFISADYSQIELRVLAHLSGDELLLESFKNDEDVHLRTAREIFGVMLAPEMRQAAKAVNFGIIYGQTAFGLAQQLGVPRSEAQSYIKNYFARYVGVKKFIDETIITARGNGFVTTMMGRKRMLPELGSANKNAREAAERMAVNSIVQGSSADLIKKAMVNIDRKLENLKTKMLLQVHDELIFESPAEEQKDAGEMVKKEMESVEKLSVPLKISITSGKTWGDLH
ncbi:MAG: DNA polymerase [bacterium]|nr:MAG: DNA polymerase [bacterium]